MNVYLYILIYKNMSTYIPSLEDIHTYIYKSFHLIFFHEHFSMQLFAKTMLLNSYKILYPLGSCAIIV